jgi:nicotinamidase/pyrazinamidase
VTDVDVCGIATDYCVKATAQDGAMLGYVTTVLADLTAAVAPDRLDAAYEALADSGVTLRKSIEA